MANKYTWSCSRPGKRGAYVETQACLLGTLSEAEGNGCLAMNAEKEFA